MVEYEDDYRIIYLSDDIDSSSIGTAVSHLLKYIAEDDKKDEKKKNYKRKPVKIYINSFGGGVYDMWALIDVIAASKTPIYTYCTGYAMSAGFKIFLAGHKRFCTKHATFLYHQLSSFIGGKHMDIIEAVEENERLQTEIEKYVMSRTSITKEQIKKVRRNKIDWYIPADEALKLGIVDEII